MFDSSSRLTSDSLTGHVRLKVTTTALNRFCTSSAAQKKNGMFESEWLGASGSIQMSNLKCRRCSVS